MAILRIVFDCCRCAPPLSSSIASATWMAPPVLMARAPRRVCILAFAIAFDCIAAATSPNKPIAEAKVSLDTSSSGLFAYAQLPQKTHAKPVNKGVVSPQAIFITAGGLAIQQVIAHKEFFGGLATKRQEKTWAGYLLGIIATKSQEKNSAGHLFGGMATKSQEKNWAGHHDKTVPGHSSAGAVSGAAKKVARKVGRKKPKHGMHRGKGEPELLALLGSIWHKGFLTLLALLLAVAFCMGRRKARSSRDLNFEEAADRETPAAPVPAVPPLRLATLAEMDVSPPSLDSSSLDFSSSRQGYNAYTAWPDDIASLLIRHACMSRDGNARGDPASFHRMMTESLDDDGTQDIEGAYNALSCQLYRVMT